MNSRIKRREHYYAVLAEQYGEELHREKPKFKKVNPVPCGYEKYHNTDMAHKNLLNRARAMYIGGKHIGSKPTKTLKSQMRTITNRANQYAKALEAAQQLKALVEAKQNAD